MAAGRAEEALKATEAAEHGEDRDPAWRRFEWEDARIDALEALGRSYEAGEIRWSCFERSLSAHYLRAYLKRLPDFDDMEAEKKALDHVQRFHNRIAALSFLVFWPALDRASGLVIEQAANLAGAFHDILIPTANALTGIRKLTDYTLSLAFSHEAKPLKLRRAAIDNLPRFRSESD